MQPIQTTPPQIAPLEQQGWQKTPDQELIERRMERRSHNQAAGIPVWGVLLILVGVIALLDNVGIGIGWIFGLALGTWFVYLGVRHVQEGQQVNWWLVGLGLLIGLGSISSGFAFTDKLVFPLVLVLVGLGLLGEHYESGQKQNQSQ